MEKEILKELLKIKQQNTMTQNFGINPEDLARIINCSEIKLREILSEFSDLKIIDHQFEYANTHLTNYGEQFARAILS